MSKRTYLQWVEILPSGHEEPQQIEYGDKHTEEFIESEFESFKDLEGMVNTMGDTLKKGSVRVIQFEDHSDENGVILHE